LTEVRANLDRLTYLLDTTDPAFDQSSAQALTQDYLANLNAILLLEQQVQVNTIVADSINQEIDAIIQTIGDTSRARTEAARSELAQAANQSRAALLATALIALALTVWAILWLGQRLLVPITALHRAAEQIGRGDLNCSLHLPGNNEFAVVADTFNHMVTQLRQTLTTLEQRVLERTQALASTNHSLQERTQSLEQTLKQLHDSETNYRSLVDHLHAGVVVHDHQGNIVMCNTAAGQLLETPVHDLIDLKLEDFRGQLVDEFGTPLPLAQYPVSRVLTNQKPLYNCVIGIQSVHSSDITWVLINAFPTFDASGQLQQIVVTFTDITDRKIAEEKLRYRALHDTLTGLPNRTLLVERLDHAIQRLKRQPDHLFAILFIDLNRFKVVNDSLGHVVGDQLLQQVARLLEGHVRSLDTVARLGGDEFVILLEQIASPKEAIQVVERIQQDLKRPMTVMGHTVFTTASIGIALSNLGYASGQDILRDADNAMYRAKAQGQSGYAVFDPAMHQSAVKLLELETNLRQALVNQEFKLHYQPIISLPAQQLMGFEALVRWYPPNGAVIPPNDFIPLAEETGLIIPLSEWVLQEACSQMQ
ncbi:MAG: diguanylate cyclase, partial [Cyanobacteria bacterium J06607_6]